MNKKGLHRYDAAFFILKLYSTSLEKESSSPFNCEITVSKTVSNAKEF